MWGPVGAALVLYTSLFGSAAAALILEEAGGVITDAYGEPLGSRPILGSGAEYQLSCVAAATTELHATILREMDAGVQRLRQKGG